MQQFRTEIQRPSFSLVCRSVGRMTEHLSRSYKHKGIFLIIIFLPAIRQIIGTQHIFEKHHIHAHILAAVRYGRGDMRAFEDIHIRMACGHSPVIVVVFYCRDIYYLVHNLDSLIIANLTLNSHSAVIIGKSYTQIRNTYKSGHSIPV